MEWARRLAPLLPGDYLEVDLEIIGESDRQLTFTGHGERSWELVQHLVEEAETELVVGMMRHGTTRIGSWRVSNHCPTVHSISIL